MFWRNIMSNQLPNYKLRKNNAKFLIKLMNQRDQLFHIELDEIKIGRGEEADLILPNTSVSRIHATIKKQGKQFIIFDADSQNGFRINQQPLTEHVLSSGDEIQIGIFTLVFLGERLEDNYYRGRTVIYLPDYDPKVFAGNNEPTFKMSSRDINVLARKTGLIHNGCIVGEHGLYFYPEEKPLSFGRKTAIVQVSGWFIAGTVARITWNNKEHVLNKESWSTTVKVNGKNIKEVILKVGDKIQIARSHFTYVMREGT